ncbi:hypothetical protein CANARDRAFT_29952 [[Candida] arabinofermentans NRRL YB-2248]|uniref:tRNA pseudouridine(55) synthase n=1 Tax=[Candida] arabinofermentans NRRL YB-2248 TaxID=983967 RepID=A0A1E4SVH3_9ASCO|nr:hypothetical protein CANARDRAFT_29952 [[Candida] arabinofermentans NRRL YB-2248]
MFKRFPLTRQYIKNNRSLMEGVFAVNKPSGITSSQFLGKVQKILTKASVFEESLNQMRKNKSHGKKQWKKNIKLKMGHGGTLDPLASGVLVIGLGSGTKRLGGYTNGSTKVYETVALLGGSTTTGDSEGELLSKTGSKHVDKDLLVKIKDRFVGSLEQIPPVFSALKMDGMPLYEYARKGLPIPRKLEARNVTVSDFQLHDDSLSTDHDYTFLKSQVDEDGETLVDKLKTNPSLNDHPLSFSKEFMEKCSKDFSLSSELEPIRELESDVDTESDDYRAPTLHFTTTVSSGTYIRSLISDYGRALGSSAYMVKLIRSRQAEWQLDKNCFELQDFEDNPEEVWSKVLEKVLNKGSTVDVRKEMEIAKTEFKDIQSKEESKEKSEETTDVVETSEKKRDADGELSEEPTKKQKLELDEETSKSIASTEEASAAEEIKL